MYVRKYMFIGDDTDEKNLYFLVLRVSRDEWEIRRYFRISRKYRGRDPVYSRWKSVLWHSRCSNGREKESEIVRESPCGQEMGYEDEKTSVVVLGLVKERLCDIHRCILCSCHRIPTYWLSACTARVVFSISLSFSILDFYNGAKEKGEKEGARESKNGCTSGSRVHVPSLGIWWTLKLVWFVRPYVSQSKNVHICSIAPGILPLQLPLYIFTLVTIRCTYSCWVHGKSLCVYTWI